MTIQYPGKLDKKREVYFTMDNTSNKNQTICKTVINKLKAAGINVQEKSTLSAHIGPNKFAEEYIRLYNNGRSNVILIALMNGVDPTNIQEIGLQYFDNRGTKFRNLGNDVIMAWFYDSCDCTREGGSCYEKVKLRNPRTDVPTGGYFYHPLQYAQNNKIYMLNQSSDSHNHPENADYTGERIAQAIIGLFESGNSTTPSNDTEGESNTDTTQVNVDTNKTVSTKTTTKTYTIPYYQKVYRTVTDPNGAFKIPLNLPYKGEYEATIKFAGDKTHNSSTKTVKVYNYLDSSEIFTEKLLQTRIVVTYTDGSSTMSENGVVKDNEHIKRVITTETYKNGKLDSTNTRTVYVDNIIVEGNNNITDVVSVPEGEDTTETVITESGPKANPFREVVNTVNDVPNIARMQADGKDFVMFDNTRTYHLTLAQYKAVYSRDSKGMQLNGYKLSKYVAFESTDTNTYNVCERGVWNFVTESIHQWLVRHNGWNWPSEFTIDPPNHRTKCGTEWVTWKGYETDTYGVTGGKCGLYIVGDRQDTNVSCGPTSASVCSQVLMNYYSESTLAKAAGTSSSGTGPSGIAKALNNREFSASVVTSNPKSTALAWLDQGKPFIWHIYWHYICIALRSSHNGSVLVANSSGSGTYTANGRMATGWNIADNIVNPYGGHVKVALNWTISTEEAQKINNLFQSMGGAWIRPQGNESLRRYKSV